MQVSQPWHGITGVRGFGSTRRGNGSDISDASDIDLLVTLAPGISALAFGALLPDAQALPGRRADPNRCLALRPRPAPPVAVRRPLNALAKTPQKARS